MTTASGKYAIGCQLLISVKQAHIGVIPGQLEFAQLSVSDDMAGADGPLTAYGLVAD